MKKKLVKKKGLIIPANYDLFKAGISQSLLTSFMQCPRKFLYQVNKFSHPSKKEKTSFGSMVHDVLDKIYSAGKMVDPGFINEAIDEYTKDNFTNSEAEEIKAFVILTEYVIFYKKDFTEKKFVQVENNFEVQMQEGFILRGKIDGIYEDKNKDLWIKEHKTKSRINEENLFDIMAFDFQNLFYVNAAERILKKPIKGVLYNVIRNPQNRLGKNETINDYRLKVRDAVSSKPEYYFMRWEIPYNQKDKLDFQRELLFKLNLLYDRIKDSNKYGDTLGRFYRNQASCETMFTCEYIKNCASGKLDGLETREKLFPELGI